MEAAPTLPAGIKNLVFAVNTIEAPVLSGLPSLELPRLVTKDEGFEMWLSILFDSSCCCRTPWLVSGPPVLNTLHPLGRGNVVVLDRCSLHGGLSDLLVSPRYFPRWQGIARYDLVHIVARYVKVCDSIHTPELDCSNIISLCSFFLSCFGTTFMEALFLDSMATQHSSSVGEICLAVAAVTQLDWEPGLMDKQDGGLIWAPHQGVLGKDHGIVGWRSKNGEFGVLEESPNYPYALQLLEEENERQRLLPPHSTEREKGGSFEQPWLQLLKKKEKKPPFSCGLLKFKSFLSLSYFPWAPRSVSWD
nr:hypothetical protein Iba_chr15bCG4620 [Ipomoea batatas]